jgi:hypothetical protein
LLGNNKASLINALFFVLFLVHLATDYFCDFSFKSFKIYGTDKRYNVIVSAYLEFKGLYDFIVLLILELIDSCYNF